jgi:uncharacterized membrane protein
MATANKTLMSEAKESLKGKWGLAIGSFLGYCLIFIVLAVIVEIVSPTREGFTAFRGGYNLLTIIIGGPFMLGFAIFSLALSRNQDAEFSQIFQGFNNFRKALCTYLLMILFIILWFLLLIVPGIIASLSYSLTFFILADEPSIGAMEAIDKSKAMMNGYKAKLFRLQLRFMGWALLSVFTLFIGLLWLITWMYVSLAKFYDDVKADYESKNQTETATANEL